MKVIVTRPRGSEEELAARLVALGHEVVHCPLIEIEPLGDEPIDVTPYDWVVLTSINGARELRRRMTGEPTRVAAIGAATAAAFGRADLVARVSTQEGLLAELPRPAGKVLFAGAEGARRLLVDALEADFVPLYRTLQVVPDVPPEGDLGIVASPSAARALGICRPGLAVVTIGPETTAAAWAAGLKVLGEAASHDLDGLVAAVAAAG